MYSNADGQLMEAEIERQRRVIRRAREAIGYSLNTLLSLQETVKMCVVMLEQASKYEGKE